MKLSNNMQLTGNKQEWSKIYALFSILSNPLIHEGDASGKADRKKKLTLIRLKRYTYEGILSFSYSYELKQNSESFFTEDANVIAEFTPYKNNGQEEAKPKADDEEKETDESKTSVVEISVASLKNISETLLALLKGKKEEFECEDAAALMESLKIWDFISDSQEGDDFEAVFFNHKHKCEEFRKIRVRSNLSPLYLVNANRASNFKYDLTGTKFSNPESAKINAIGDNETGSIERLAEIDRLGAKLKYRTIEGKFFLAGLQLIDMQMPKILAEMVRNFYVGENVSVKDLTEEINVMNIFKVKTELIEKSRIYEYKVRQFLYAAACGMKPTKTWRGNGYNHTFLYITKEGDMICYDPMEKETFEKFLFNNTRLCIPNEDKNRFGSIEKEDGQWLIKLNLEIRFL